MILKSGKLKLGPYPTTIQSTKADSHLNAGCLFYTKDKRKVKVNRTDCVIQITATLCPSISEARSGHFSILNS